MKTIILFLIAFTSAFAGSPTAMKSFIEKTGKEPTQYIVDKFKENDLIVFSDLHKWKHEMEFITSLLPIISEVGVNNLAIDFGNAEDQLKIDDLLNNEDFNRDLAIEILRNYKGDGIIGFKEYLDLFYTAWEINQSGDKNFRIILLGNSKTPVNLPNKTLVIAKNTMFDKAYSIMFHTALQKEMDAAYVLLDDKNPVACDLKDSPIKLSCDGYIFLEPHQNFEPLTWIPDFVDESYLPVVKNYFKDLKIESIDYATDICKAHGWMDFELERGTISK